MARSQARAPRMPMPLTLPRVVDVMPQRQRVTALEVGQGGRQRPGPTPPRATAACCRRGRRRRRLPILAATAAPTATTAAAAAASRVAAAPGLGVHNALVVPAAEVGVVCVHLGAGRRCAHTHTHTHSHIHIHTHT